ncbi:MAG: hypothetical protein IPM23_03800 [Candidatus Melainabacteria bacterium]|nr:hypothetical protein [Candidatus Melainabacteria bacterium]
MWNRWAGSALSAKEAACLPEAVQGAVPAQGKELAEQERKELAEQERQELAEQELAEQEQEQQEQEEAVAVAVAVRPQMVCRGEEEEEVVVVVVKSLRGRPARVPGRIRSVLSAVVLHLVASQQEWNCRCRISSLLEAH